MKIIIFGASGFLGTVLANYLSRNHQITAVSRENSNFSGILSNENLTIRRLETSKWSELIREVKPDTVISAFWNGVAKGERDKELVQLQNISLHKEIALICKKLRIETFFALGTQAEFPASEFLIPELPSGNSSDFYGTVKRNLYYDFENLFDGSETLFVWARVFSVYGPNDKSDSLINGIAKAVKENVAFLVNNPHTRWSFLYEEDFASAISMIINNGSIDGIVNVANPKLVRLGDISHVIGYPLTDSINSRIDSKKGFYPITEKLDSIGWKPKFSFKKGFKTTFNSYKELSKGVFLE
jgi:nucleoside-diphosphate-sugar epimerase